MARILGALPGALIAARNGLSATQFEKALRASGFGARSSEVRALYKFAQDIVQRAKDDPFADLSAKPQPSEMTPWPTRKAGGVKQVVTIFYRDKTTGEISKTFYNVVSPTGVARQEAISKGIEAYSAAADRYKQQLIGAVHTSAYVLAPTNLESE